MSNRRQQAILIGIEPAKMTRLRRTYRSLKSMGVNVIVFNPYQVPRGRPRILKGIIRYLLVIIQLLSLKGSTYHFYNVPDIVGLPLVFKRGTLIYDVRSPWFSSVKESIGSSILWRMALFVEWLMTKKADVVITANTPLAKRARRWGAMKVVVVPNYPPTDFVPTKKPEQMRQSLGIENRPVVLFLGKLSRLEGIDVLKRIICEVVREIPQVVFLVVGDGPSFASLHRFVRKHELAKNVLLTGWVPHSEVANYIAAADVCLLPRDDTSFSPYTTPENILKVGEYLAIGKPVVVSKIGGFKELEFPIIPVEPSEMAGALIEYLRNPREVPPSSRSNWDISHMRLKQVYSELNLVNDE